MIANNSIFFEDNFLMKCYSIHIVSLGWGIVLDDFNK